VYLRACVLHIRRFSPLTPKLYVIFNNSVRTTKKTPHFIVSINWLKLLKEIIALYSENHTKYKNTE
jgi:hypothetical protein